jgi:hypothetical protein
MYPTIVIVIVNTQRSLVDTQGFTAVFKNEETNSLDVEARQDTFGHISFAMNSAVTKSDVDTFEGNGQVFDKPFESMVRIYGKGEKRHVRTVE